MNKRLTLSFAKKRLYAHKIIFLIMYQFDEEAISSNIIES